MSDCPRCWDTPCTCGYMGYTVKFNKGPSPYEIDQEKRRLQEEIDRLQEEIDKLKKQIEELNKRLPAP